MLLKLDGLVYQGLALIYIIFSVAFCVDDCSLHNYFFTVLTDGVIIHTVSKL